MIDPTISNPIIERLPDHLKQYILPQNYDHYTSEDQAVWRYVMRKSANFLPSVAHESYLTGLTQTGISTEEIPSMYGMNRILKDIGWAAVAVDGLIPSAAFMEFQAYNVLVIASDIRLIKNIEYTPTPDIIHEAAGHAPIIANPDYSEYLRMFGEIGARAISSHEDRQLFLAVRELASLKEKKDVQPDRIAQLEKEVVRLQEEMQEPSELQLLKNLHWWTIEYGLIGSVDDPKIYGAGLLSSIGESKWCLSEEVKKLPLSIDAVYQSFDVTQPQPQLFVTPSFSYLSEVLNEFAETMAVRTGGLNAVDKLIRSQQLGTIELSTGLQISGVLTERYITGDGKLCYIQTAGPTALAYRERELIGQSTDRHQTGFGTAIGKLVGINMELEDMSPRDLKAYGIVEGNDISLEFEGGITITGHVVTGTRNIHGKIMLIALKGCSVLHEDRHIFHPDQGIYHLAIGSKVISAYAGPADLSSFDLLDHVRSEDLAQKSIIHLLEDIYQRIRSYRILGVTVEKLSALTDHVLDSYQTEWLILIELYELLAQHHHPKAHKVEQVLQEIADSNDQLQELIYSGLQLIHQDYVMTA